MLSRTGVLRRRLRRLLGERERPSRLLNLRQTVARIDYRLTGSAFESSIVFYELARQHFPDDYLRLMKLRMPPYVRLVLNNEFPRSHITTHLTRSAGLYFGPFRSRTSAERFEAQFLDLFQMRRCQEDLAPSPSHPGCIYGEMAMCLRPCQEVVGAAEYAGEVARVAEFLHTDGRSLLESIGHSRDRLSEEMMFEEAARQHKRYEKVLGGTAPARRTGPRYRPAERGGDHARRWRPTRWRCGSCAMATGARRSASASKYTRASRCRWTINCARCWAR